MDDQEDEFTLHNEKVVWRECSVDRDYVADIDNYRHISDYSHKRQFLLSKSCHVFNVLIDQLKTYHGPDIIPKELSHLLLAYIITNYSMYTASYIKSSSYPSTYN